MWGQAPLTPDFDHLFGYMDKAVLHGARVVRPRAPVVPSLSNASPRRFFFEKKKSPVVFWSHYRNGKKNASLPPGPFYEDQPRHGSDNGDTGRKG